MEKAMLVTGIGVLVLNEIQPLKGRIPYGNLAVNVGEVALGALGLWKYGSSADKAIMKGASFALVIDGALSLMDAYVPKVG